MIRLVSFDIFRTLLDIQEDKNNPDAYDLVARFLGYHGVAVTGKNLSETLALETARYLSLSSSEFPDVDILRVLDEALSGLGHSATPSLISESALVLRAATTRLTPVKGAFESVATLVAAGYRVCLCSNTQRAFTIGELRAFGLLDLFDPIVFSSDVGACKPDPAVFSRLVELAGVAPSEVVHIGDNYREDAEGAHRFGLRTVWLDRDDSGRASPAADRRITLADLPDLPVIVASLNPMDRDN